MTPLAADRFVHAVRRRLAVTRGGEAAGGGLLVGTVALAAHAAVGRWVAAPTWPVAASGVVAAAALLWRWPTRAATVAGIDAAFGWDDLLATATGPTSAADPAFVAAVAAAADAACRGRSPGQVRVGRWGRRAWAGVALGTAAAGVAAAVVGPASRVAAVDTNAMALVSPDDAPPPPAMRTGSAVVNPNNTGASPDATAIDGVAPSTEGATPTAEASRSANRSAVAGAGTSGGTTGGSGTGSAVPSVEDAADLGSGTPSDRGTVAGGGRAGYAGDGRDAAPAGRTAPAAAPDVSAWRAAGAPPDRRAAAALADGSVPAGRRRLVRSYFGLGS